MLARVAMGAGRENDKLCLFNVLLNALHAVTRIFPFSSTSWSEFDIWIILKQINAD